MNITATQPVIKIGTSKGVTLPAKALKAAGIKEGDKVDIVVKKHAVTDEDHEVLRVARDILERYNEDFKNLSQR